MPPFLLSWISPEGGSLVRMYLSLRLSESTSVPFKFCSVIFEEVPGSIQKLHETFISSIPSSHYPHLLTSWELQPPVDSHSGSFTPRDVHGELQTARVGEGAICEGESHFIHTSADRFRGVDQQLVQDILVGEGRPLRQHPAILQRLGVELPSA